MEPTTRDEGLTISAATTLEGRPALTTREGPAGGARASAGSLVRLPEALAGRFRILRELDARGIEADLLVVEPTGGGAASVIKLYRAGIHPKAEVLERLAGLDTRHTVRLIEQGTSEGRSYEVMEYAAGGSLSDLLREAPGHRLARPALDEVIQQLAAALSYLHGLQPQIIHRDIKPDNILLRRREPLELVLGDFGLASELKGASWKPSTADRTERYAAPEAADGQVSSAVDWWSFGILVAEAAAGRHPFGSVDEQTQRIHFRERRPVPLDAVADERVRLLCRGLLVYDRKKRWGTAEVGRWLAGDTALVPPLDEAPAAAGVAPFKFAGRSCRTMAELAAAMVENWSDAKRVVARATALQHWLEKDAKEHEAADWLQTITEKMAQYDAGVKVTLLLPALDPALPPTFDGTELTRERLIEELATASSGAAPAFLVQLWDHLPALANLTKRDWLREVYAAVDAAHAEAERLDGEVRKLNRSLSAIDGQGWVSLRKFVLEHTRDPAALAKVVAEAEALLGRIPDNWVPDRDAPTTPNFHRTGNPLIDAAEALIATSKASPIKGDAAWTIPMKAALPLSIGAAYALQRLRPQLEELAAEITRQQERRAAEEARLAAAREAEERRLAAERAAEERRLAVEREAAAARAKRERNVRNAKIAAVPAIAFVLFIGFQIREHQQEATEQAAWTAAQRANTIQAYNDYLAGSQRQSFAEQARAAIVTLDRPLDEADWQRARRLHSVDGYREYLRRNGIRQYEQQALAFIDDGEWAQAQRLNTSDAYRTYLQRQPSGRYRQAAQNGLSAIERQEAEQRARLEADRRQDQADWQRASSMGTSEALRIYLRRNGSRQFEAQARELLEQAEFQRIYQLMWQRMDGAIGRQFISEFPRGRFAADMQAQIENVEFQRALQMSQLNGNLDPNPLRRFVASFPNSQFSSQARQMIESFAYNQAASQQSAAAMRRFLAEYPSGLHAQEAIQMLRYYEQMGRR